MKLENLLTDIPFLLEAVPLTIPEEGIAYLNDISLWVLTFNSNHPSFDHPHITVKMVIDLLKNHASCYPNQENVFAAKQKQILDQLEKEDPETELNLI